MDCTGMYHTSTYHFIYIYIFLCICMYVCVYDNIHNICNILLSTYTGLKYYIYIQWSRIHCLPPFLPTHDRNLTYSSCCDLSIAGKPIDHFNLPRAEHDVLHELEDQKALKNLITRFYHYPTLDWFQGNLTGTYYINHGENHGFLFIFP